MCAPCLHRPGGRGARLATTVGLKRQTQPDPCFPVPRAMEPTTFEIFSTFPPTVYNDDALTLQAAGLVPNATLLLRVRRASLPAPGPK